MNIRPLAPTSGTNNNFPYRNAARANHSSSESSTSGRKTASPNRAPLPPKPESGEGRETYGSATGNLADTPLETRETLHERHRKTLRENNILAVRFTWSNVRFRQSIHATILGMTLILSHISAMQLYRSDLFDLADSELRRPVRAAEVSRALLRAQPSRKEVESAPSHITEIVSQPMHLLIGGEGSRSRSRLARCHVAPRKPPRQALLKISDNLYASAPHFMLEQLAPSLSLTQLICLGAEICGEYRLAGGTDRSFRKRPSFGTPEAFAKALDQGPWTRGGEKISQALRHTCAASASPMETIAAVPLYLPCAYGGYGLPKPKMNHRISISRNARMTSGKSYLIADICWPEFKICAEYQSTMFHTGADRIDADARRQTALEECGYSVFEITAQQALSIQGMDGVAHAIAKKMGRRIRPKSSWRSKQKAMRDDLLAWHGFEP